MIRTFVAAGLALALGSGMALAQTGTTKSAPAAPMKMSQAECQTMWNQLDSTKSGSVTQTQASTHVTDFKTADANSDGRLSSTEFMNACDRGLVRSSSASSGAGTGTMGSGSNSSSGAKK